MKRYAAIIVAGLVGCGGKSSTKMPSGITGEDAAAVAMDAAAAVLDLATPSTSDLGPVATDLATPTDLAAPAFQPYACPAGAGAAVFVSEVAPPATLAPWQAFAASITYANCSGSTWSATTYHLGTQSPQDNSTWIGTNRVVLPADLPSGMQYTFAIPLRAGALTGPAQYQWEIVDDGVAWLPGPSPVHTIDVEAVAKLATICTGVTADVGGVTAATAAVQSCIDATPSGGTLELPAGIYELDGAINLNNPITLRASGTQGNTTGCLAFGGPPCVVFRAAATLDVPRGFVKLGATSNVTLDHVVIDGARARRLTSAAASTCAAGTNNGAGMNATSDPGCTSCSFLYSGSARALCGTGFEYVGDNATFRGSAFIGNGDHATTNMWSDGLTLISSNGASVTGCTFADNSDVDLIFGGTTNGVVQNNVIQQARQSSFAGLMLDNFNGTQSGNYAGTVVSGNTIDCGAQQCDFAVELGPHAWYLSANITGGTVTGNTIRGGKFQINAEGAGTAAAPITVTGNTLGASPASASFNCGTRTATAFNVSPDSVVNVGAGPQATAQITFHQCP